MLQLGALLALDAAFYFLVIPAGIVDPVGLGMDDGLPPSFSARLVAILAGALMLGRWVQLAVRGEEPIPTGNDDDIAGDRVTISLRSVAGILAALLFAGLVAPALGFLPGGALLILTLLLVMGERRLPRMLVATGCVMLLVWLLFEVLLSIRLPGGWLLA